MYINNCYKYEIDDIVYVGGNVPEGATILEIMNILNAEDGYVLQQKSSGENVGNSVWLVDEDNQDNYIEIKESEDVDSK